MCHSPLNYIPLNQQTGSHSKNHVKKESKDTYLQENFCLSQKSSCLNLERGRNLHSRPLGRPPSFFVRGPSVYRFQGDVVEVDTRVTLESVQWRGGSWGEGVTYTLDITTRTGDSHPLFTLLSDDLYLFTKRIPTPTY